MTDDSPVLLPCPFCGGQPEVLSATFRECWCRSEGCAMGYRQVGWMRWNRRASGKTECRVVGGEDVADLKERLALADNYHGQDRWILTWGIAKDALALLERAAPLHEQRLDVGRDGLQHDAESRVRPEAPVPLTKEPGA